MSEAKICDQNCVYLKEVIFPVQLMLPKGQESIGNIATTPAVASVNGVTVLDYANMSTVFGDSLTERKIIIEFETLVKLIYSGAKSANELFFYKCQVHKLMTASVPAMLDGCFIDDIIDDGRYRVMLRANKVTADKVGQRSVVVYVTVLINIMVFL